MGRIYLLHWVDAPRRSDVLRLIDDIEQTRRRIGRPLAALTVVSRAACHPERAAQVEMLKKPHLFHDNCEFVNMVLQADGFAATIMRAFMAQIALKTELSKRHLVRVFSSIDDAIERMARDMKQDADALKHQISRAGIVPYVAA